MKLPRHADQRIKGRWLVEPAKQLLRHAPAGVRRWVKQQLQKDMILIPEKELEPEYRKALVYLGGGDKKQSLGDYLEFGVFHGASLGCMYRASMELGFNQLRLFGFDSFEGLPEKTAKDLAPGWEGGYYKANLLDTKRLLAKAQVDLSRVHLIKGWFSDTLTDELIKRYGISKASLIMIDCDLYSSAKQALDFCAKLIRDEAMVFFDDWESGLAAKNQGEKLAFDEFLAENPDLKAEEVSTYYHTEQSPPTASKVFLVRREGFL